MTREETIEAAKVMLAYAEGKTIEFKGGPYKDWTEMDTEQFGANWNFETYEYRVKSEPRYRQFLSAEELMEAIKEHGDWVKTKRRMFRKHGRISKFDDFGIWIVNPKYGCPYEKAFEKLTFADGSPFGKLINL